VWEVCISALGMSQGEFLFEYSMAQVILLVDLWATRQAMMWGGGKKKQEDAVKSKTHPDAIPVDLTTMYTLEKMLK